MKSVGFGRDSQSECQANLRRCQEFDENQCRDCTWIQVIFGTS